MYKLIMLPQPILVRSEEDMFITKKSKLYMPDDTPYEIIAGIEGLPTLDLSLIAKQIGWVDVEKLAEEKFPDESTAGWIDSFSIGERRGFIAGFKAAQSLNEKKYSEGDMIEFAKFCLDCNNLLSVVKRLNLWNIDAQKAIILWLQQRKPKEYQVEVEMDCTLVGLNLADTCKPKITNNTIKVIKIL